MLKLKKIVSGGQTGVDRAALDFAIRRGIPHGGYCPKGRRSESGRIAAKYRLTECASADYAMRTALNVAYSDGTLILTRGRPEGSRRRPRVSASSASTSCVYRCSTTTTPCRIS